MNQEGGVNPNMGALCWPRFIKKNLTIFKLGQPDAAIGFGEVREMLQLGSWLLIERALTLVWRDIGHLFSSGFARL